MKTLKLFNAVVYKTPSDEVYVSDDGYVIHPGAMWAKDEIIKFYNSEKLEGRELNKTFHKSFATVRNSTRYELALEQIRHYASTYGSNFQEEVYIPNEILDIPDLKVSLKVIQAYSQWDMQQKCLDMLNSGIALKEDTIHDLLEVLINELEYKFKFVEEVKNKEASVMLIDHYGMVPTNATSALRFAIYKATGSTLLIKSNDSIAEIKASKFNPEYIFVKTGLYKMAEIFNRFKPLFLAFKSKCPRTVNKISKLSKKVHKPLIENPLNKVTTQRLQDRDLKWLEKATPFAILSALQACHRRLYGQTHFTYLIRNGKSWTKSEDSVGVDECRHNLPILTNFLQEKYFDKRLIGTKVYFPDNVEYGLPTSEKMFVGKVPVGTKFYGNQLAVGIYWENSWGARDLDLSGISINNKIGWNAGYVSGDLTYSGDMTDARDGAVEYMHFSNSDDNYLLLNNVFCGEHDCKYKIVIGEGSDIDKSYMMDPNKVWVEVECNSVQRQTVLGLISKGSPTFTIVNAGAGHLNVSMPGGDSIKAIEEQYITSLSFNNFLTGYLGCKQVSNPDDADLDFSLDKLSMDSFIKVLDYANPCYAGTY